MASVWRDLRTRGRPVWCIKYKGLDGRWHRERTESQTKDQAQRMLRSRLSQIADAKEKGEKAPDEKEQKVKGKSRKEQQKRG